MNQPSNLFVVLLGVGTVFVGLICLIILCKIIGAFCSIKNTDKSETNAQSVGLSPVSKPETIQNRSEIIAAVSAVIAEELGTDVSAIRILSFKKI